MKRTMVAVLAGLFLVASAETFEVRVENVSTPETLATMKGRVAVPLSPGVFVVHRSLNPLFVPAGMASPGLERLAEDGDPALLAKALGARAGVFATPLGQAAPAPIFPGQAYVFRVSAEPGDRLSLATMFVQSNDWFYAPGPKGIPLFMDGKPIAGDVTRYLRLWDAGTEVNEPAGEGMHQAPRQKAKNAGPDEMGVVHEVTAKGLSGPVIRVTIQPVR